MVIWGNLERNCQEGVSPWTVVPIQQTQPILYQAVSQVHRAGPAWSQSLLRAGGQAVQKKEESPSVTYPTESLSQKWGLQNWQKPQNMSLKVEGRPKSPPTTRMTPVKTHK